MTSRGVSILLILVMSWPAIAQSDTSSTTPAWFMTLGGGALFAKRAIDSAPSISMTQGIRLNRFALTVGIGHDFYKDWRTMPVFTGLSIDFVQRPAHAFYLQMNTGYSKAWYLRDDEGQSGYDNAGGYFYHPAIGLRAGKGKVQIHLSAGYKIQNIDWNATQLGWGWWSQPRVSIRQQMERFSFLIGIGLR